MDTTPNHTVEVYDNLTGEHYTRDCTPEELAFYEQFEKEQNEAPNANADDVPSAE
jgi:hypothetical protein